MTTYRVGNHQPQNLYRDDQYIGVMFTAEDAALVVEALNERERLAELERNVMERLMPSTPNDSCIDEWQSPHRTGSRPNMCATCSETSGKLADLCTCTKAGPDPACVVHQGRRAKGPKPPPLGPGCICDGSGRTCPRHGAVI